VVFHAGCRLAISSPQRLANSCTSRSIVTANEPYRVAKLILLSSLSRHVAASSSLQ
jgi:hypothetical protein